MKSLIVFISICLVIALAKKNPCVPTQVHIALAEAYNNHPSADSSSMRVVFHTEEKCEGAFVKLHLPTGDLTIQAKEVNEFNADYEGKPYHTVVHVFDFPNLPVAKTYKYTCYDDKKGKETVGPFEFYVPNNKPSDKPTTVVMFGDADISEMGKVTMDALAQLAKNNFTNIDAMVHMGDIAYDLESKGGKRGDQFMEYIQPLAASMPYMVFAGNHETIQNFSNLNMRYKMPNYKEHQNHLHSYNLGNIHFAVFNIELLVLQPELIPIHAEWLRNDLKEANANRAERPWIVVTTHRPLYCSKKHEDCLTAAERFAEIVQVLEEQKVDLFISGHVHYYDRMFPLSKGNVASFEKVKGDVNFNLMKNPNAPIFVLNGVAGHDKWPNNKEAPKAKKISARIETAYSYNVIRSVNSTHLYFENVHSENNYVSDWMYIIKDESHKKVEKIKN